MKQKGSQEQKAVVVSGNQKVNMKAKRQTIFDYLDTSGSEVKTNKYCNKADLGLESTVENFFLFRLLKDLGYDDPEIKPKNSIEQIAVNLGRKKVIYRPDYVIVTSNAPRWLIDAKGVDENVDDWIGQCSSYALALNRKYKGEKPVQYFAITNGLVFKLFKWDEDDPILTLLFGDLVEGNDKFEMLFDYLNAETVRKGWSEKAKASKETITLKKPSIEEVKKLFKRCHNIIWNIDNEGDSEAFFIFVKLMFIKLWEDRRLHEDPELTHLIDHEQPIPLEKVKFSVNWIKKQEEQGVVNPVDDVLFDYLLKKLEESIERREKKRIFQKEEHIGVFPDTIKEVVSEMEDYYLFGVDEDLNGRMFETFLNVEMRGKGLGQYFTPRSITKLMTKMAAPKANRDHIDRTLDGCCGTGGFLIEALTEMRNQIRANKSLSENEADAAQRRISNDSIYGIDVGDKPPIARIARINMYLHGDGGSRIYKADGLDKSVVIQESEIPELKVELAELKEMLLGKTMESGEKVKPIEFDIILTNPPFSKNYSTKIPQQKKILDEYKLLTYGLDSTDKDGNTTAKKRSSLRSSVMFIERYGDLLKHDGSGRLVAVIDDSILSGKSYDYVRDYIREKFIIRAIISLPGDAFQRSGARSKTSIIYLTPRPVNDWSQPDVFMYESMYVGLDDKPRTERPSIVKQAKVLAEQEIGQIIDNFNKYLQGEQGNWLVPASRIQARLDVKYCLPRKEDITQAWRDSGIEVLSLKDVVEPVEIIAKKSDLGNEIYLLRIDYDGYPDRGEPHLITDLNYSKVYQIKENDIVISNINAVNGSIAVIPKELKDVYVSSEYTVLRLRDKRFNPYYIWGYMRSPEIKARMLSYTTGMGRHRVAWGEDKNCTVEESAFKLKDLPVPLAQKKLQDNIAKNYRASFNAHKARQKREFEGDRLLNISLNVNNEWAISRLKAAKPPK